MHQLFITCNFVLSIDLYQRQLLFKLFDMKTLFRVFPFILFLGSTFYSNAASQLTFEYKYEYTRSFALKMDGLQNETHYIRIIDENGTILFSEKSEDQNEFQRMYNLEHLTAGKYQVVIENEQKLVIQPVLTNGRFLKIETTAQKEIYKPVLTLKEAALVINMLHFEKGAIQLTLKDKSNEVVYSDELKTYGSLNKQLNIARLPAEEYELEIATSNYVMTKNIDTNHQVIYTTTEF